MELVIKQDRKRHHHHRAHVQYGIDMSSGLAGFAVSIRTSAGSGHGDLSACRCTLCIAIEQNGPAYAQIVLDNCCHNGIARTYSLSNTSVTLLA